MARLTIEPAVCPFTGSSTITLAPSASAVCAWLSWLELFWLALKYFTTQFGHSWLTCATNSGLSNDSYRVVCVSGSSSAIVPLALERAGGVELLVELHAAVTRAATASAAPATARRSVNT